MNTTNESIPTPINDAAATHLVEEGAAFARLEGGEPPVAPGGGDADLDVIVIGGGQAGLSVGYHLARRGVRFVILDASERIGDAWRNRWDSLRLFTPARYNSLDGMPFPAPGNYFPTKDEMADYLESYAEAFELPVISGTRVDRLWREDGRYLVDAGGRRFAAEQVVVAMASYQRPKVPACAGELRSEIVQLHSSAYRNPSQLADGDVLLVGAGNSGAEIGIELAKSRQVWLSGNDVGKIPFALGSLPGRLLLAPLLLRVIFHRLLTIRTRLGRKAYPKVTRGSGPLVRTKLKHLAAAGVKRVPRLAKVEDGLPVFEDGRTLEVANVVWCTGFHPGFDWIDLPIFDDRGYPRHDGGVVDEAPGLYFVGLHFLYALSSGMVHGVGRDADRIAETVAARRSVDLRAAA